MPPSPPPIQNDIYNHLITALHPPQPVVLEIEILPSTFPSQLLHESPAIGLPKSLLIPLFLKARSTFFDHVSSRNHSESYDAALQATAIILLFDPNHLTAANFRKRHLQRCADGTTDEDGYRDRDLRDLAEAVGRELRFLTSLVTSSLSKHAKSSTLWAQRLWVVRNFFQVTIRDHTAGEAIQTRDMSRRMREFWDGELIVVMKAGERHPRNYYAWEYARQLFSCVRSKHSELAEESQWDMELLRDGVKLAHRWCLMHPRDISGWAFLIFLVEKLRREGNDVGNRRELGEEFGIFVSMEIKEFAKKFGWKGESIEWFLKTAETLNIGDCMKHGGLPENP